VWVPRPRFAGVGLLEARQKLRRS